MDATTETAARAGLLTETRATLALAWPLVLTNLSQFALGLVDTLVVGRLGTAELAAATIGATIYWAMLAPSFGLALAAAPLLAQARGQGQRGGGAGRGWVRAMRRAARHSFWAAAAMVLPTWLLMWHSGTLLVLLGQDPVLAALAADYVRAIMWGLLPFCGFIVLRGFLAAMERPLPALWVTIGAVVLNLPLNILLVFGGAGIPALGIVGAGLASAICNLVMLLAVLWLIARDRRLRRFRLLGRIWAADPARLVEVVRLGLPIAGSMLLEIGVFAAAALAMGWHGATAVAAHAIAIQVASTSFMVPMGVGQAATARVGILAGAGDPAGAARAGWIAIAMGTGFMVLAAGAIIAAPAPIAWAFLDPDNPGAAEVAALAMTLLVVAGAFQVADGVQVVAAGALRGLKDTRVPMLLAALGYWGIGLPVGIGLSWAMGGWPVGLWVGLALGLVVVAVLLTRRWIRLSRAPAAAG